jgi:DNA-binding response OmpR family regulator
MIEKVRILLAEDDDNLGVLLNEYLSVKGYETDLAKDGEKALKLFKINSYDLCIFDIMMPKKDGISLAKDVRILNEKIPIIFLTAKSMKEDVLEGFDAGADDYLTKPFIMEELLARVAAILKRTNVKIDDTQTIFKLGDSTFDSNKQIITKDNEEIKLTTKESDLLKLLCVNKNEVLERNYALKVIWQDDNYFNARSMDVYITKLRKHLKNEEDIQILNIHGKGFKLLTN